MRYDKTTSSEEVIKIKRDNKELLLENLTQLLTTFFVSDFMLHFDQFQEHLWLYAQLFLIQYPQIKAL